MRYLCLISLLVLYSYSGAQSVENVSFYQDGQAVVVSYDLLGNADYQVELYVSLDNGQSFEGPLKYVSGAVGKAVSPARGLNIRWDAAREKERFISYEVVFEVHARKDIPSDMVLIPGGTFTMGSPTNEEGQDDDETQHQVRLSDYYIGRHEVTFAQYDAFCEATKREKPDDRGWGRAQRPVVNVSWYDAVAYCNWRSGQDNLTPVYQIIGTYVSANWEANGYRLPTEAEWEFAARGDGGSVMFATGKNVLDPAEANFNASADYKMKASITGPYRSKTIAVGSLNSPNGLGLHDMSGNVYEWCWDWYSNSYPKQLESDPRGPESGSSRVFRGGSWYSAPRYCRVAHRSRYTPSFRRGYLGFRLSRSL